MRDADAGGKTITEVSRALECFTDRTEALQLFNQYVNDDPAKPTLLFFHGVGGNGKSLLLRFLRKHCCRLFTGWEPLQDVGYSSLLKAYPDEGVGVLPSAFLDFGRQPNGEDSPQEAFKALLMLRRGLSGNQLRFPLYDFACIWYLHKTKRLTSEHLTSLFPAEELALLNSISDVASKGAIGALATAGINVFAKHFKDEATLFWYKRRLAAEDVERIQNLDAESELMDELPAYFARDLNASMKRDSAPKRVVLFFDTHEAFWREKRGLGDDQWFRRLLQVLQPELGIVVVVAGREIPGWGKARKPPIPDGRVEYRLIGNLSEASAQKCLELANIEDAAIRGRVCAYAQVEPGQVHPLLLGLCADIILEASERSIEIPPDEFAKGPEASDIGAELMDRFLRYVGDNIADAVRAVSACRSFDQSLYFKLDETLHFGGTDAAFRKLVSFSFVSPVEGRGPGQYRIHDLLRRLIHESTEDFERRANEFLEGYYRQIPGPAAAAEAIYHASRLDCKRGVREWVKTFDSALWSSDYPLCRALRAVRGALGVMGRLESGMLARCEADFCKVRALYAEADREYKEALGCFERAQREEDTIELQKNTARLFLNFGELQATRNQLSECAKSNRKVIEICELALGTATDDMELYDLMAGAHLGLGDVNIWESKSQLAIESYSAGIKACDHILQRLQNYPLSGPLNTTVLDILNDKAYGLGGIGDVESSLYRHEEAIRNYRQAEYCYDEALRRAIDPVVQNDKAYNFVSIAESEIALLRYEPACENCNRAVTLYDEILQRAPEETIYHSNRSRALRTDGVALTRLSRYEEALQRYDKALDACSEALRQAPVDTWALCNKGLALLSLGEMHSETAKYEEAQTTFTQSLDAFDSMLAQSPDDGDALAGKGRVLFGMCEVLSKTLQQEAAVEAYRQSVAAFDRDLEDAPEDVEARKDKARALQGLGQLFIAMEKRMDGLEALSAALTEYSRALDIAPQHEPARKARDRLAASLGELRTNRE